MAKRKDDRVAIVAGTWFKLSGVQVLPGAIVLATPQEAEAAIAMRWARAATADEATRAQ